MKKFLKVACFIVAALLVVQFFDLGRCTRFYNEDYLQRAEQTTTPNTNFLFACNASLPGRVYMTFSGKEFRPCINTVSAFYNKYHTCSNCEDFIANPSHWKFEQVDNPQIGDLIIYIHPKTGKAHHAAMLVDIKNGKYYINHAVKSNYYKHVELKSKSKLLFYRYTPK